VQEYCPLGSVRGALGNRRPYLDKLESSGGTALRVERAGKDLHLQRDHRYLEFSKKTQNMPPSGGPNTLSLGERAG
jgi:hypothetical protein